MNQFALVSLGLLFGLLLAIVAAGIAALAYFTYLTRRDLASQRQTLLSATASLLTATGSLKSDVTLALSSLDADRLHAASQTIQRNATTLANAVNTLSKLVYAQQPQLDPSDPDYTRGMDVARSLDQYDISNLLGRQPLTDDDIERQQGAGITTLDQIAMEQARRQGLADIREERTRIKQENLAAAQQQQAVPLDSLAAAREQLIAAGVDPLTFMPQVDEATRGRSQAVLPDLPDLVGE